MFRINDQRADKKASTKKEDIESLLNAITGSNNSNRRMDNQRVSLSELQESSRTFDHKAATTSSGSTKVNQSQSDSNLQKMQKEGQQKKESKKRKKIKVPHRVV